jgi:hypothetical protein
MTSPRNRHDLEDRLRGLAASIETPTATDYPDRVRRALAAGPSARPRRALRPAVRRLAIAAVAVVAIVVALVVPASRSAIASWFGFAGIEIHHGSAPATTSAGPAPTPPFGAGDPVSLATAERAMGRSLRLPSSLGRPDDVLLTRDQGAVVVTAGYRSAFGLPPTRDTGYALLVTEIGNAGDPLFQKILDTDAKALAVTVAGRHPGVYIAGPQWIITLERTPDAQGESSVHEVDPRTSANTLIWSDGRITYRIEGEFSQHTALGVASRFR